MTSHVPTRQLGKNGPQVTALGFGAMGLSSFYGTTESDEERFKVLDKAYELGERFWDSADMYGDNEDLIGKWFKRTGKRNDVDDHIPFQVLGLTSIFRSSSQLNSPISDSLMVPLKSKTILPTSGKRLRRV